MKHARIVRLKFYRGLWLALHIAWPVFSMLLGLMFGLGIAVSYVEHWPWRDGIYFACVTGLTVGYGDLVPTHSLSRVMAIGIGFIGVLLTALFAAISVHALHSAVQEASPE